jgi:hypothetical protein
MLIKIFIAEGNRKLTFHTRPIFNVLFCVYENRENSSTHCLLWSPEEIQCLAYMFVHNVIVFYIICLSTTGNVLAYSMSTYPRTLSTVYNTHLEILEIYFLSWFFYARPVPSIEKQRNTKFFKT